MTPRPTYTQAQIDTALMALIAWAGNRNAAIRALKAEGQMNITHGTLTAWSSDLYVDRYMELREKYSEQMEAQLVHEFRDVARQAVEVQKEGLDRALNRLQAGKDDDPSRTAANAARVAQMMTDKMLSLSGRPTSIREDRNLDEIMRSLAAKGVLQLPQGDVIQVAAEDG